jgi:hypothetical protein
MGLFNNMYFQAFVLSFLSVCIIRYFFIKLLESVLNGISITKSTQWIFFCQRYIYWIFPLLFAVILPFIRPVNESYTFNFISYYGLILLIYNALFKTIIKRFEDRIKKL